MIFGDQKSRDMARSILPSRRRKRARDDRASLHRSARRVTRHAVRQLDVDAWDDGVDFEDDTWRDIRFVVSSRRSADKLNHFQRWAFERTRHLDLTQRIDAIRPELPAGLIGEHARLHLEHDHRFKERTWVPSRFEPRFLNRGETAELLRAIIERGDVRTFHDCLKTALIEDRVAGLHDVLRFLKAIEQHVQTHCVVDDFLCAYKMKSRRRELNRSGGALNG